MAAKADYSAIVALMLANRFSAAEALCAPSPAEGAEGATDPRTALFHAQVSFSLSQRHTHTQNLSLSHT